MYTATTKLRHRQTHSTHPTSLCADHSHLTGFPLPINGPPLGLAVYLLLSDFFVGGAGGRQLNESGKSAMQSVGQPVTPELEVSTAVLLPRPGVT